MSPEVYSHHSTTTLPPSGSVATDDTITCVSSITGTDPPETHGKPCGVTTAALGTELNTTYSCASYVNRFHDAGSPSSPACNFNDMSSQLPAAAALAAAPASNSTHRSFGSTPAATAQPSRPYDTDADPTNIRFAG
jgi:hypothetical protein